jgi:hypothetical protein
VASIALAVRGDVQGRRGYPLDFFRSATIARYRFLIGRAPDESSTRRRQKAMHPKRPVIPARQRTGAIRFRFLGRQYGVPKGALMLVFGFLPGRRWQVVFCGLLAYATGRKNLKTSRSNVSASSGLFDEVAK